MGALDFGNKTVSSKLKQFTRQDVGKMINLLFGESSALVATNEEFAEMIERLLFGKSNRFADSAFTAFINRMEQYQKDELGVVSPKFIYEGVVKASGWKWYLCSFNKELRALKISLVKGTLRWEQVNNMIELLQDYIEAVNSVLSGYYRVNVDSKSSREVFDDVDFMVRTDPKYAEYNKIFVEVDRILG